MNTYISMTDNRYKNGKVYKITDTAYNECYIGSTIETLSRRIAGHRRQHKQFLNNKKVRCVSVYTLFDNYGLENCKIELLELWPCNSLIELRQREGYYIKTLECVNKNIAGRTKQEYANENKDRTSELRKQRSIEHKDKISERRQKYYNENKDKISELKQKYYNENKDKLKERRKQYKSENQDKLREQRHQQYLKHKITQLNNNTMHNAKNTPSHTEHQEDNTNNGILNLV